MNKKGFTLMELMAVVMIIGILTSVALPQYRKVVDRSRFTKAQVMAKSMYDSCQRLISEWGVDNYSSVPLASSGNRWRMNRLDIGSEELLPTGFTLVSDGVIAGAGFQYALQNDCSVNITQTAGNYPGTTMSYDGQNFYNCQDAGSGACDIYNVE